MGTKFLARTVLEGGRAFFNTFERRESHACARADERDFITRVTQDSEWAEEQAAPTRRPVRKSFHDKLGPARRWLASHVGRPWAKIYAELRERFDVRTTPGRHIVFDHMLSEIVGARGTSRWHAPFRIDAHGILRARPRPVRRARSYPAEFAALRAFAAVAAGRRVGGDAARRYWFVEVRRFGANPERVAFRQDRALTAHEETLFLRVPDGKRAAFTYTRWEEHETQGSAR
jgi:hypothetical protein